MKLRAIRTKRLFILAVAVFANIGVSWSQLPAPQQLAAEDDRAFRQELARLHALLATANDQCAVGLQIANTYAAAGQYGEAFRWLRKVIEDGYGFDPSRDPDFAKVRETTEFHDLMKIARLQTPPISNSKLVATFAESNLFPENLAFDFRTNTFFFGNTVKNAIVRCRIGAQCLSLTTEQDQGYVLGLKINPSAAAIWAATNAINGASVREYKISTGKLLRVARLQGKHLFNDLAISSSGEIYVTDTSGGAVYKLERSSTSLQKIAPEHMFTAANGIALAPDETKLYVSAWVDGIAMIDLKRGSVTPLPHPSNVCLAYIDGLYATGNSLLAIQNGPMMPRVVQFQLTPDGTRITRMNVLERRNPLFNGITTGTLSGDHFYYAANPQTDRKTGARHDPLRILVLRLMP